MSSRAMKKLLRDSNGPAPLRELEHSHAPKDTRDLQDHHHQEGQEEEEEEEEEDDDDSHLARRPPARNLFALVRHGVRLIRPQQHGFQIIDC